MDFDDLDGFIVVEDFDGTGEDWTEDGSDPLAMDYGKGHGPDGFDPEDGPLSLDWTEDGPDPLATIADRAERPGGMFLPLPAPEDFASRLSPEDRAERDAFLRSAADRILRAEIVEHGKREDTARSGGWGPEDRLLPGMAVGGYRPDPEDCHGEGAPVPPEDRFDFTVPGTLRYPRPFLPLPLPRNPSSPGPFPRSRSGRAPSSVERRDAARCRDAGRSVRSLALSIGIPVETARSLRRLSGGSVEHGRSVVRSAIGRLPEGDRDAARTVKRFSLDWTAVGPWMDDNGRPLPRDPGMETLPMIGARGTAVVIPLPLDGPGSGAMLAMYGAVDGMDDIPPVPVKVARPRFGKGMDRAGKTAVPYGVEMRTRMAVESARYGRLLAWGTRPRSIGKTAPVRVEITPRVSASGRYVPRTGATRYVEIETGKTARNAGRMKVNNRDGRTIDGKPTVRKYDPAAIVAVPRITPEGERDAARDAARMRGFTIPTVDAFYGAGVYGGDVLYRTGRTVNVRTYWTGYGPTVSADPEDVRIVPTGKGSGRKGSGAGSRGGRKGGRK